MSARQLAKKQQSLAKVQTAETLDWADVRLFLALYRARRLSGAGASLGVDLSTASRRLARLERDLAVSLFDRTREGLVPTRAATRLVKAAEDMEEASLHFSREVSSLEEEVAGTVRVSCTPGVAETFVVPLLPELVRRAPRLTLELDASTQQADLTRREADLALRTIRPTGGPLVMQRLTRSQWIPMANAELARAVEPLTSWDDVRWLGWAAPLTGIPVARWLATRAVREPILRSNSFAVQVAALKAGLGAALVPEPYALAHSLVPLRVSRALQREMRTLPIDDLYLVAHQTLRHTPRVATVWEFLIEVLAS